MAGLGLLFFTVALLLFLLSPHHPKRELDLSFAVGFVFYFSCFVAGNDEGCEVNPPQQHTYCHSDSVLYLLSEFSCRSIHTPLKAVSGPGRKGIHSLYADQCDTISFHPPAF